MTRNYIDLVGKTLKVLEVLDRAQGSLSIADIAKQTGLIKSTTFRILYSLKEHNYVEQRDSRGEYSLTMRAAHLGRSLLDIRSLKSVALPYIRRVWADLDETVALACLENGQPIMAEILESTRHVRVVLSLAAVCYFHATALGKAMAAYLPKKEVEETLYLQGMPRLSEHTIRTKKHLFRHLEEVRQKGYAVNHEESHHGAIYVAVPIFDKNGSILGGVNVGFPATRYSERKKEDAIRLLKQHCFRISEELGCDVGLLRRLLGPVATAPAANPRPRRSQPQAMAVVAG